MKILHITGGLGLGGSQAVVRTLAKGQSAEGCDVCIWTLRGADTEDKLWASEVEIVAPGPLSSWRGLAGALLMWWRVARGEFDVVHSHLVGSTVAVSLPAILSRRNVWISTYHGAVAPKWRRAAAKVCSHFQDAVVAVSSAVGQVLISEAKVDPGKIAVIHNGVPEAQSVGAGNRNPVLKALNGRIIGCVGHMAPYKGQLDLVRACPYILEAERDVVVVFVGDGPDRMKLAAEAERLGLSESVHFLGQIPDASGIMAEFELVVVPSHFEGFNLTLIEAMSLGVPVVATRCGGPEEIVDDGFGKLVPVGQPRELARGVLEVLHMPHEVASQSARRAYENGFSANRMLRSYRDLYQSLTSVQLIGPG